jgi:RNA polymerase sigma-70 factor (ECF subfamily)
MEATIDNNILLEFQKGKHDAFQCVFTAYYSKLVDFAWRLTGSTDEAEDITIVAFHNLFSICSKFESAINIQAFLYTAIRNRGLNCLRDRKTRLDFQKVIAEKMEKDVFLKYDYEITDVLYDKVQAAIENLPLECRRIFKMLFIDELKPAEIAEILNITTSTVYNQKQNALKALRLTLGENSMVLQTDKKLKPLPRLLTGN